MASWMVHLRVAEGLLEKMKSLGGINLSETEFIVGNIAPDSGVPNEDWSVFTPSSKVSHYRYDLPGELKNIHIQEFSDSYLTKEKYKSYNSKQRSFYLGYFDHLMTDILWVEYIVEPLRERDKDAYEQDSVGTVWKWKKDWYDLDFLYLKKNPEFAAFHVYEQAVGFHNSYLDFFAEDAFDNRREYITGFYRDGREDLERDYPWLTEKEMDDFVALAVEKIYEENLKF